MEEKKIKAILLIIITFFIISCNQDGKVLEKEEAQIKSEDSINIDGLKSDDENMNKENELTKDLEGKPLDYKNMSDKEVKDFLCGTWYYYYPMPAGNFGHSFKEDGSYTFNDSEKSTIGLWRVFDNRIEISIEMYESVKVAIEDDLLFPNNNKNEWINAKNKEWMMLGSLDDIRIGITDYLSLKEIGAFPARITFFKLFREQIISVKENFWYYGN